MRGAQKHRRLEGAFEDVAAREAIVAAVGVAARTRASVGCDAARAGCVKHPTAAIESGRSARCSATRMVMGSRVPLPSRAHFTTPSNWDHTTARSPKDRSPDPSGLRRRACGEGRARGPPARERRRPRPRCARGTPRSSPCRSSSAAARGSRHFAVPSTRGAAAALRSLAASTTATSSKVAVHRAVLPA